MILYEELLIHTTPWSYFEITVFLIFMILEFVLLCLLKRKEKINTVQFGAVMIETIMMALIYGTTVFTRVSSGIRMYELLPGWSWRMIIQTSDMELLKENILNIIMFFPVGVVLPFVFFNSTKYRNAIAFGLAFSAFIEINQLLLCRGLFEWDDMIHNSLGCLLGCIVGNIIFKCVFHKKNRNEKFCVE